MSPLHSDEKQLLLQIDRKTIESALGRSGKPEIPVAVRSLAAPSGAFVTLRRSGRLCGCIGRVSSGETLVSVVAECAIAAATDDPRFRRLEAADLCEVEIELSVLSPLWCATPGEVVPGVHGIIVSRGERRGVLLPQVATEHHWLRERLLEEACQKAGLAPDAWQDANTRIEIFTAEVFSESDYTASPAPADGSASAGTYSSSHKSPS